MTEDAKLLARVDERTRLILLQLEEIKKGLAAKADQTDVDALDTRVRAAEQKVWYASGLAAGVAFLAGIFGKGMVGGGKS